MLSTALIPNMYHNTIYYRIPVTRTSMIDMYPDDFQTNNFEVFSAIINDHGPLFTGLVFYVTTMCFLYFWETVAVPVLKLKSIIPDVPLVKGQLTEKEKHAKWITPLTADRRIPIPDIEDIEKKQQHMIGILDGIPQYITSEPLKTYKGVQEQSTDWSEYFGKPTFIYKKNKWM